MGSIKYPKELIVKVLHLYINDLSYNKIKKNKKIVFPSFMKKEKTILDCSTLYSTKISLVDAFGNNPDNKQVLNHPV